MFQETEACVSMALKENVEAGGTSEDTVLDVDITAYLKNHFSYGRSIPPSVRDDTINSIDLDIQTQLAILLRSLKLVKEVYEDMPTMIKFFFNELLVTIKRLPPLSLSTYWEDNKKHLSHSNSNNVASLKTSSTSNESSVSDVSAYNDLRSCIGISSKDNTKKENYILPLPELAYLKDSFSSNNSHLRDVELNEFDPLGIVMNVFEIAEQFAVSLPIEERGPPLSICLALAIKSGRISLILHTVHLILYNGNGNSVTDKCDIDVELLNDVKVWLTNWAAVNKIQLSSKINGSYDTAVNNGILLSFGKADQGKLGHGDTQLNRLIPTIIESLQSTSIKKVVSMSTNTLALDTQGNIYVWGTGNMIGANGMHNSLNGNRMDLFPAIIDNCQLFKDDIVVDISCGLAHTLFLTANGKVYARGNGGNGRLGLNDCVDRHEACLVNFNSTATSPSHANAGISSDICIKTIQCGACHSLALTTSGTLYTWGKNTQGQCGLGVAEDVLSPTLNKILSNSTIVSIAAGWEHSACVSSDGSLYTWGSGYKDSRRGIIPPVLGHGNNDGKLAPEKISSLVNIFITNVTCGWDHCLALDNKGRVLSWGSGQNGKLGNGNEENVAIPCYIPLLENIKIVKISAGSEHSACISEKGVLYTWGHGDGGRLGHGDNAQCLLPSPVIAIGMMNAVPFDLHCGDKFTMLIVHQTVVKEETKAAHADTSNIEFSQEWTHRHVDRLINAMSIEGGNKASVNREQLGSILLSLAARCSNIASSNHYNTRYGIECSNRTFANMLRILELYKSTFVASAVTSNEQTTKSLVNTSNFEQLKLGDFDLEGSVNLDDSIDSVSHTVDNSMVFQDDSMADIRDRIHLMRRTLLDSATAIDVISPLTSVLVLIKQNLAALVKQYSNFIKQSKGNKSDNETTSSAIIATQNTSEQLHGNESNNDEVIDDDDLLSRSTSASGFSSDSYDERERDEGDINDNNLENNYDARASDVDIRDDTSAYNEYSADVMRSRDRNTDSSNPVGSHSRSNNNLNNLLAPNSSVDNLSPVENEGSNNSGFVFDFRGESIGSRAATRAGSAPGSRRGSRGVIAIGGASGMSNNNVSNNNASNNNRGNNPLSLDCNLEESMDESVNNNAALLSPGGLSVSNDDLFNDLNLGNQDGEEADLTEGQQMYQARFFKENEQMSVEDIVSTNQNPMLSPCLSADSLTELANISSSERPSMKHSYRDRESSFDRTEASDSELETSQEGLSFNFLNSSNPMNGEYFIDDSAVANVEVQRAILSSMETMYDYNSSNKGKKLTTSGNKEYYDLKHYYFDMNSEQVLRSLKESVMQLSLASYNIIKHYSSCNNNDSAAERVLRGSIEVWKHCQEVYANGFHVFYGNSSSLVSVLQSVIKTPLLNLYLLPGICDGLNEVKKAEYNPKFVETIDVIGISCDDLVSACTFHQNMFLSTPTALKSVSEDLSSFPPAIVTCLSTSLVSILSSVSSSIILNSLKIGNYADVDSLFSKFTDGIVMEMDLYSKEVVVQTEPQLQTSFGVVFLREFVNLTNSIQTEGDKSTSEVNGVQKICHITPACILLLLPQLLKIFVKYNDIRSNANGQYIELLHKEMLELVPSVASCIHNLQRLSVRVASIGLKKQLISTTKLFDADLLVQKYFDNNCTIIDEGSERNWFRNFHCVYSRHGSFFNPKFTHVGQVIELNRERASSGHISTIVASSLSTHLNCLNSSNGALEWLTSAEFWNKIFTANTPTTNACIQKILNNLAQDCSKHADGSASRNKTANIDEHSNMRVLLFLILQLLNPAPNSCSKDVADATEKENCVNSCILSILISNHFLNDIISYGGETDTWMKLLKNIIATVNSKLVYLLSQPLCSSLYRNTTVPLLYSHAIAVDAVVHNVTCLHSHIRRASGSKSSVSLTESNDYRLSEYFQRNNESVNDGCSHVDLFFDLLSLVLLSGSKAIETESVVKLILNNEIQRRAMILSIHAMGRFFASSSLPMVTSFMNIMLKSSWNHRDVTYYFEYDASSNYFCCMVDAVNSLDTALVHLLRAYKFNDRENVSHNIELGTTASKVVEFLFAVLPNKSISSKANSYPLGMNVVTIITKIFVDLLEMLPSLEKSQPLGNDPMVIDNIEALLSAIQTTLYHLNNMMGTNNSSSNSNGVISYLTVLNKALRKLGQLSLSAVSYFQTFLVLCKKLSVTFIMPSLKLIQSTSPTIAMNVFTPQGDYTLGFWLWIPSTVASFGHQDHNNYKVHILSRIQETGDLNFVSLVGAKSITSMMTNPTVILSYEEGDAYLCVYVSVNEVVCSTSTNSTKAKRVKTTKKISLKSSKVVTDQWIHCAIDLCQTKSNDIEKTEVTFFINGAIVDKGSTTGSRSQLHQNMVIGTIPCDLQSNNVSACKPLAISDIYWMSSSASSASSNETRAYIVNGLSLSDPPSTSVSMISSLISICTFVLKSCSVSLGSLNFANNPDFINQNMTMLLSFITNLVDFAVKTVVIGDDDAQSSAFQCLNEIVKLHAWVLQSDIGDTETSVSSIVVKTPPRSIKSSSMSPNIAQGSAMNVANSSKAASAVRHMLIELLELVGIIMTPTYLISSVQDTAETKPMIPSKWLTWLRRILHVRDAIDKSTVKVSWLSNKFVINENLVSTGVASVLCTGINCGMIESSLYNHISSKASIDKEMFQAWYQQSNMKSQGTAATSRPSIINSRAFSYLLLIAGGGILHTIDINSTGSTTIFILLYSNLTLSCYS
jgi:alpha-tubulin suppressor-like RCC1 family protein